MLNVKTPDEVYEIIKEHFAFFKFEAESVSAAFAAGRVLSSDIISDEDVPGFNRSTVDGYAVRASDTFGCSEGNPVVLSLTGEVLMGESAQGDGSFVSLRAGTCMAVSTGGEIPEGADAAAMVENTEDYGSGMIGFSKPVAPGENVVLRGDDVSAGTCVLSKGTVLSAHDIGILSALGYFEVFVRKMPVVGIISTGDELVSVSEKPHAGQVRDINSSMLLAAVNHFGAAGKVFGIIRDDETAISRAMLEAAETCDVVLISGGSSAGIRDMTARVIDTHGELLLHGIAMKPGKPTILGRVAGKPIFGLPGHPVAAYLVTELFVRPLIARFMGTSVKRQATAALLGEALSSNHGREEYLPVRLTESNDAATLMPTAHPIRSKSALISSLSGVDGYICIPRDCEGISKGTQVTVTWF